jgi:N-acetyl-anhydromuramoyl-L-alanine amidase
MTTARARDNLSSAASPFSGGWYRFASLLPSPNFDPRPPACEVSLVVIHSISLPPGEFGDGFVQDFFLNKLDFDAHPYFDQLRVLRVSAHFFVRRNGELIQFVSCDDRAWHAGRSQFEGRERCNDFSIGIELEGIEGGMFSASQYDTLAALTQALAQQYPLQAVASHRFIAPDRKADPGDGFDWACLRRALPNLVMFDAAAQEVNR